MPSNHLEELAAEWYEYRGYFVRRNVRVGRREAGGHEGEIDVVAFDPSTNHLVHVETSMDSQTWEIREERFRRKFETGERHIRTLFHGLPAKTKVDKIAILGLASRKNHQTIGGAKIQLIDEFIVEILAELRKVSWLQRAVPEQFLCCEPCRLWPTSGLLLSRCSASSLDGMKWNPGIPRSALLH